MWRSDPGKNVDAGWEEILRARLDGFAVAELARRFQEQDEFLHLDGFLPPAVLEDLLRGLQTARAAVHRNYLPGHKKGGSVGRGRLDACAGQFGRLYRSPALQGWLASICGRSLQPSPASDPHAYALYFYTEAGDHIGWHYDSSYYRGARYTVLIGLHDRSSCRLEYRLHTRSPGRESVFGSLQLAPGAMVVFNGDRLQHRITPSAAGEARVSLTLEYLTDPRMSPVGRLISNMKDAVAYFGFREVFARRRS